MSMSRGERVRAVITALDRSGEGVAEVEGVTIRVPGVTPGQEVEAEIVHVGQGGGPPRAWAQAVEIRGAGVGREAPCRHAAPTRGACGGCPLMHLPPAVQRGLKQQAVAEALAPLGVTVEAVQAAGEELGYRCRSNFVAARDEAGRVRLGSRAPRSAAVAEMTGCGVLRSPQPALLGALEATLSALATPVVPEPGGLRYVGTRAGADGQEALIELITSEGAAWVEEAAAALLALPGVVGVSASVNANSGNAVRTQPPRLLGGRATVEEVIAGVTLEVGCEMFTQLNAAVASAMAEAVAARAPADARVIWDLYCGAGVLGLVTARSRPGAEVFGAEVHAPPTRIAAAAAARLGVAGRWVAQDLAQGPPPGWPRPDVALVNPPRRGLDAALLQALVDLRAPVVYMSCNPVSFARDAAHLIGAGLRLDAVEAWDMIPQTTHVEVVGRFLP